MSNNFVDKLSSSFSSLPIFSTLPGGKDSVNFLASAVGTVDSYKNKVKNNVAQSTFIDVNAKDWYWNDSQKTKINSVEVNSNTGLITLSTPNGNIESKLRTSSISNGDLVLFETLIKDSDGGVLNNLTKTQAGPYISEINVTTNNGAVVPLSAASVVINGTLLDPSAMDGKASNFISGNDKDNIIGNGELKALQSRNQNDPLETSILYGKKSSSTPVIKNEKEKLTNISLKDKTFNTLYKNNSDKNIFTPSSENYTFKIGDTILSDIPPTHVTVSEMRSSDSVEMLNFQPMDTANPIARIVIKINAVFSGADIDGKLKRIITQYKYVPFNIIHSYDLINILSGEESFLSKSQGNSKYLSIPVTMDEYTLYTIEGHPGSLGCTMQFSLFNYTSYFDGDLSESFQYEKAQFDQDGNMVIPTAIQHTTHLENAIHPYNFDIENILARVDKRFNKPIDGKDYFDIDHGSYAKIWKLSSFQDIDMKIVDSSVLDKLSQITLLCNSISIRYENIFAWHQIIGYPHASAQYIGPGIKTASINAKISYDNIDDISRLFKTYQSARSKDYNAIYDDRYLIQSALTDFADCNVISISDIVTTSLPSHPGYADLNLIFKGSPYLSNATQENNKIAQEDDYWGLQRIVKLVEKNNILQKVLSEDEKKILKDTVEKYQWVAVWAKNAGKLDCTKNFSTQLSDLISIAVSQAIDNAGKDKDAYNNVFNNLSLLNCDNINWEAYIEFLKLSIEKLSQAEKKDYASLSTLNKTVNNFITRPSSYIYSNTSVLMSSTIEYALSSSYAGPLERNEMISFLTEFSNSYGSALTAIPAKMSGVTLQSLTQKLSKTDPGYNKDIAKQITAILSTIKFPDSFNFMENSIKNLKEYTGINSLQIIAVASKTSATQDIINAALNTVANILNSNQVNIYGMAALCTIKPENGTSYIIFTATKSDDSTASQSVTVKKQASITIDDNTKLLDQIKNIKLPTPFAAHRYYPYCDSFVNDNPFFSSTVGSYYSANITNGISHFQKMLLRMRETVKNSIAPTFDYQAWMKVFKSDNANAQQPTNFLQIAQANNDPFFVLEALKYPQSRKEIVTTQNMAFSGPLSNVTSSSLAAFNQNISNDPKNTNRPFTGLSDYIFIDAISGAAGNNTYMSPAVSEIRKTITNKKKMSLQDGGVQDNATDKQKDNKEVAAGATLNFNEIYNYSLYNSSFIDKNGDLRKKSDISTNLISQGIFGSQDKGLGEYTDKIGNEKFIYLTKVATVLKNPALNTSTTMPKVSTPTEPVTEQNSDKTLAQDKDKIKNDIINIYETNFKKVFANAGNSKNYGELALAYIVAQTDSSKFSDNIVTEASVGIKSAIMTILGNSHIGILLNKSFKNMIVPKSSKLYLTNSEPSYSFEYRSLSNINTIKRITLEHIVSSGSINISNLSITAKYFFDITLLLLTSDALNIYVNGNDNGVDKNSLNPFFNPNYTADNNNDIVYDSKNISQLMLTSLALPNISYKGSSFLQNVDNYLKTLYTNTDKITVIDIANDIIKLISNFTSAPDFSKAIQDSGMISGSGGEPSEQASTFLINQFMQSMLPTTGMENAFPTYKMYIIDPNLSDIKFFSMDNWYDYRAVKDLMIIKSKEDPAHYLKCRVVVDERFITTATNFVKFGTDREPVEYRNVLADASILNTSLDHSFWQGKVPLRVGMRICIKLGYHSDPRLLDTVFIGTITGLQGTMDRFVYDLEAYGDGRELSEPATQTKTSLTGENYGEIITKILRSNPSVAHFGRNYGTILEKFSKEHYIIYSVARSCINGALKDAKEIKDLLFTGSVTPWISAGVGGSAGLATVVMPFRVAGAIGWAPTLGIGASVGTLLGGIQATRMYKKLRNDGVTGLVRNEISKILRTKLTADSASNTWFNWSKYFNGHTFDASKWQGQIHKHLYELYETGHDPIDQNIWAVDIWTNFTNILNKTKIVINNTTSIWDILKDIKRIYPNYALDVRPYGGRSTLYLGPLNWLIMRTDDPVAAIAVNLDQTSSASLQEQAEDVFKNLNQTNSFYQKEGNPFPNMVDFQRTHMASSDSNIIFNGIQSTPNRGWNAVVVNAGDVQYQTTANSELHPSVIKTVVKTIQWTSDEAVAQQYALGLVKEGVEKMYGGTLALKGNPKIEPYDRIYILDTINRMYGWIEVETVIHKFDMNSGFTTHITPNMVCSINSDAYKTTSQIIRSILFKEDIGGYVLKTLAGLGVGALIAGSGILTGGLAWAVGAASVGLFLFGAAGSVVSSVEQVTAIYGKAISAQDESVDLNEFLREAILSSAGAEATIHGMYAGFGLNYIAKAGVYIKSPSTDIIADTKSISTELWNTIKSKWDSVTHGDGFLSRMRTEGNEGPALARQLGSIRNLISKLSGGDENIPQALKDIKDKGINWKDYKDLESKYNTILEQKATIIENIKSNIPDAAQQAKALENFEKSFESLKTTYETVRTTVNSHPSKEVPGITKEPLNIKDTKIAKGGTKFIKGFFLMSTLQLLVDTVEAFPRWMESYMFNYMTKANCITISPLYSKSTLMMAGLDGWQKTNAWMHLKGLILNAKKVFSQADMALNYITPNQLLQSKQVPSSVQDAADKDQKKGKKALTGTQASRLAALKPQIDLMVEKAKSRIKQDCAKEALTTDLVMGTLLVESSGADPSQFGRVTHANSGGLGAMQLVIKWQGDNFYNTAKEMGRTDITSQIDKSGGVAARQKNRTLWADLLCNNVDVNLQAGINFLADNINDAAKKNCNGQTIQSLQLAAAKAYGDHAETTYNSKIMNAISRYQKNLDVTKYYQFGQDSSIKNVDTAKTVSQILISSGNFALSDATQIQNGSINIASMVDSVFDKKEVLGVVGKYINAQNASSVMSIAKSGNILIGTQGLNTTVAYQVVSASGSTITVVDSQGNIIDFKSNGQSNSWTSTTIKTKNGAQLSIAPQNVVFRKYIEKQTGSAK